MNKKLNISFPHGVLLKIFPTSHNSLFINYKVSVHCTFMDPTGLWSHFVYTLQHTRFYLEVKSKTDWTAF